MSRNEDGISDTTGKESGNVSVSSASSSNSSGTGTHDIVTDTLKDVFNLQHNAMKKMRLDSEKYKLDYVLKATYDDMVKQFHDENIEHEKTKLFLQKEQDKLRFAMGEIEILTQHLKREKHEHEELLKSLHQRLSRETKRSDVLRQQCSQHEETIQAQRDELHLKDNEISNLKQRLKSQKNAHKNLLDDIELQRVQQQYMSRSLNRETRK